jgi:Holliday junction resolvase
MPSKSKTKGNTYEREIVKILTDSSVESLRAWGSNGKAIGEAETTDIKTEFGNIQCKRRKVIPQWLKPPDDCLFTTVREDRGENYAIIRFKDLVELLCNLKKLKNG